MAQSLYHNGKQVPYVAGKNYTTTIGGVQTVANTYRKVYYNNDSYLLTTFTKYTQNNYSTYSSNTSTNSKYSESTYNTKLSTTNTSYSYPRSYYTTFNSITGYGTQRQGVYVSSVAQANLAQNGNTNSASSPYYVYKTSQSISGYGTCSRVSRSHYTTYSANYATSYTCGVSTAYIGNVNYTYSRKGASGCAGTIAFMGSVNKVAVCSSNGIIYASYHGNPIKSWTWTHSADHGRVYIALFGNYANKTTNAYSNFINSPSENVLRECKSTTNNKTVSGTIAGKGPLITAYGAIYYSARYSNYVSSVIQNNLAQNGNTNSAYSPFYRYSTQASTTATLTRSAVSRSHYTTNAKTTNTYYAKKANYVSSQYFTQAGTSITQGNTNTAENYYAYGALSTKYYDVATSTYVGSQYFESNGKYEEKATASNNATFYRYSSELVYTSGAFSGYVSSTTLDQRKSSIDTTKNTLSTLATFNRYSSATY